MRNSLVHLFFIFCYFNVCSVEGKCGELFLTVSAIDDKLELNWDFTRDCNDNPPDLLTLYYEDVANGGTREDIQTISIKTSPVGYHKSEQVFGTPALPGNWNENDENPVLSSHCYPYRVESIREATVVDSVCIKIEPTWMENLGSLRITDMFIPGTHDSGAYTGYAIDIVGRYTWTQKHNLWGQLVSGIRYLDIRVGLYPELDPIEWINHGLVRCTKMEEEFNHIANFLRKSPNEIVLLHFKSFEVPSQFTEVEHNVVLDLVQRVLGGFIFPRTDVTAHDQGPTLDEVRGSGKRLVVIYSEEAVVNNHNWLWYHAPHKWGNQQSALGLYNFLKTAKDEHDHEKTPFCVLISVLTPSLEYIIRNLDGSLRHMADEVNPYLSFWVMDENWEEDINIMATDFFMGNNLIDIAIRFNAAKVQRLMEIENLVEK